MSFTDKGLKALKVPAGSERVELPDPLTPGLRFRKTNKQAHSPKPPYGSFSVIYRVKGRSEQDRLTLGKFPRMSVAQAREEAEEALKQAARGIDPKRARMAAPEILTFEQLFDDYLERYGRSLSSGADIERKIRKDALPLLGPIPADDARAIRAAALKVSDRIVARDAPITARRVLAMLSGIYTWGVRRNLVDINPVLRIEYPGEERAGTRVLTEDELRALLLRLLDAASQSPTRPQRGRPGSGALTACALLSRVLLGQRTSETMAMARPHLEHEWWNLPKEITKTGRAHRAYLLPLWRELVWPRIEAKSAGQYWCFPGRIEGRALHDEMVVQYVQRLQKPIAEGGLGFHFTARDLRRTFITNLARLGVPRDTRRRMVNHQIEGIDQKHYDLYDYDAEKRSGGLTLDAYFRRLLYGEPAAVLPFRA
jgi:integrase